MSDKVLKLLYRRHDARLDRYAGQRNVRVFAKFGLRSTSRSNRRLNRSTSLVLRGRSMFECDW